jgi:hypothetical protein
MISKNANRYGQFVQLFLSVLQCDIMDHGSWCHARLFPYGYECSVKVGRLHLTRLNYPLLTRGPFKRRGVRKSLLAPGSQWFAFLAWAD